jgi:hypothetical protein
MPVVLFLGFVSGFCFWVLLFGFAFDFDIGFGFLKCRCELPKKRAAKRKKKRNLSELRAQRGRVISLPALSLAFSGTRRAVRRGRLSLLTFFGEAKKVSGPPGPVPASLHEGQSALHHRSTSQTSASQITTPTPQPPNGTPTILVSSATPVHSPKNRITPPRAR